MVRAVIALSALEYAADINPITKTMPAIEGRWLKAISGNLVSDVPGITIPLVLAKSSITFLSLEKADLQGLMPSLG